jgi:eukaryotic-like serine/threonine-protein kinase
MRLSVGERLGPYEVVSPLGAGGMGEVYRARDTRLHRDVAIKLVSGRSSGPGSQERLQLEARAISQLQHPHICTLYDIGTHQSETFLVMELLVGETLYRKLLRGAIPLSDLLTIAIDLAGALEYAHGKGIIHRDIKPANIFITAEGSPKLMDFGLVKQIESNPDALTLSEPRLSSPGAVLGTISYMSPEQLRGEEVDKRSDLFSFGAVLYEGAAGKMAFPGATAAVVVDAILNRDPVGLHAVNPALPQAFSEIVHKVLDKRTDLRYQSASELRTDLRRLQRELASGKSKSSVLSPPSSPRSRTKLALVAAVLALVAASGFWILKSHPLILGPDTASAVEIRPLTNSGHATVAAASPDGRYVAYVNRENGKSELRLLQSSTGHDIVILPGTPEVIASPQFSPDGDFIYFLRETDTSTTMNAGIFRIATLGGAVTPIATGASWFGITISPDGKHLAYISYADKGKEEQQIIIIDSDGTNHRTLTSSKEVFWFLAWSPQGDRIAAVTFANNDMILPTISIADGSVHNPNSVWDAIGQPVWSPDGRTIFAPAVPRHGATKQIWAIDPVSGARHPVTSGTSEYNQFTLSITVAGDLVAGTTNFDSAVWVTNATGSQPRRIGAGTNEGSDSIAWVGEGVVSSNVRTLTTRDVNGGRSSQFSSYSSSHRQLAPCGPGRAAFLANDDKHSLHIAQIDLNTGVSRPITDGPADSKPACTQDGSVVVFQHCPPDLDRCYLARKSVDSPEISRLLPLNASDGVYPRISPDESTILFQREPDAKDPNRWIGLLPIAGGEPKYVTMTIPTGAAEAVRWSPNGQELLFSWRQSGVGNIWSMPLNGGHARQLTQFDTDYIFDFDVARDGRLAISRGKRVQDIVLIKNAK